MSRMARSLRVAVYLVAAMSFSAPVVANVVAVVDRAFVELNETFILKVTVDSQIDAEPNTKGLDADFYVGSRSQISNTTIVNGDIQRSRTWSFALMAKHEGELVIPPISIGSQRSNPVHISVAPQSIAVPGEADIFITAEVDNTESYVQAQVLYTIKTYRAVATRQPRWSEPASSGVETLVEIAGEEKKYDALLNGKAYNVVERRYAFFPQQSGELQISPARFEARVLRNGRITGRKVFQSEPRTVIVKPIPPPPADYPDATWFPAKSVELSQEWSRELSGLHAGEPITRKVSIVADGQLETQIPVIELADLPGIRVYPDKPELRTVAGPAGVRALRRDQYALISTRPGTVELPELVLPWWDVNSGQWELARLPATVLEILPSADSVATQPAEPVAAATAAAETRIVYSELWRRVSEALLLIWLLTLLAWWWSRRPAPTKNQEPAAIPVHKQQARFLKAARKAALSGDAAPLKSALLDWGRLQWPNGSPRSVDELAKRISMPLSIELNKLSRASYGPDDSDWDGAALAKALRSFSILDNDNTRDADGGLPLLLPDSTA